MAVLELSKGKGQFKWQIVDFDKPFTTGNGYIEAGITIYRFTEPAMSISGVVSKVYAKSDGSYETDLISVPYDPGQYTFWGYAKVSDGKYWPAGSDTVKVETDSLAPDDYGDMYIDNVSDYTIKVSFDPLPDATDYEILCKNKKTGEIETFYTSELRYVISDRLGSTTYILNYRGYNRYGYGPYMPEGLEVTTLGNEVQDSGEIYDVVATTTTISFRIRNIEYATFYDVVYKIKGQTELTHLEIVGWSVTIEGLTPGTTYILNYRGLNDISSGPYMSVGYEVKTQSNSITPWNWGLSNGNATAQQTIDAYNAIMSKGPFSSFHHIVWNDMVNKTKEIIDRRGAIWNSDYGSIVETQMTDSDRKMTAKRFNALWWNLSHFVTVTGAQKVYPGDIVKGSYFKALTDAMNKSIP